MSDAKGWTAWSPAERESFFDAISRHRRAAWRVTLASGAANAAVALVVAILMAPLFYGALALLLDLINLAIPAPDLVPRIGHTLDRLLSSPARMTNAERIQLAMLVALPGLIWMGFVLAALRRVLRMCMSYDSDELQARAPDTSVLAEQRLANVVSEMAIAASIPAPRVLVAASSVSDAVAFGVDERRSTIVVSQGLLSRLNREQMEGIAADLIASIANGDIRIGLRAALSITLFSLIARLGSLVSQPHLRRNLAQIVRATLLPTANSARKLLAELGSPLEDDQEESESAAHGSQDTRSGRDGVLRARWKTIRPYLWLPLAGPLVMTGFFGAIVNLFILGPLLSLAWRQRKYMADATAVRLTRDPDTLASALQNMSEERATALAPWASHMSVVSPGVKEKGLFGGNAVPMFPSIDRRLRALGTLGAHLTRAPRKMPVQLVIIVLPLLIILGALVAVLLSLLIWVSLALTALFSGIPFAIVHALLRWLGHH